MGSRVEFLSDSVLIDVSETLSTHFDLKLIDAGTYPRLDLRMNRLRVINSVAVREWMQWIHKWDDKIIRLYECRPAFIQQVNIIKNFLPSNATISSFYVPYFSEQTGEEQHILLHRGQDFNNDGKLVLPNVVGEDGTVLKLDTNPERYFHFLGNKLAQVS